MRSINSLISVGFIAVILSGCAAAVTTDGESAATENPETAVASCSYLRTQQASCNELKKAYDEGFRAGKEIIAAEFRTRTELNQPYVWKPPMVSEVDLPGRLRASLPNEPIGQVSGLPIDEVAVEERQPII